MVLREYDRQTIALLLHAAKVVKAFIDGLEDATDPAADAELARLRREVHAPLRAVLEPAIARASPAK
jgi:hypothetical protein